MKRIPPQPADKSAPSRPHLRIHGTIARQLGVAIVSGQYAPGDLLEGEIESSEQLAISRTAYREALRILAAKGLIDARPKVGTRVNPHAKWHFLDTDVLEWIFAAEPTPQIVASLFELRDMVEPAAAALAALRRTPEQLQAMRQALTDMEQHTLATQQGQDADQAFHATVLAATHNPFLVSLATPIGTAIQVTTEFKQRDEPLRRDPMPDHERVYAAIESGNAEEAHAAMRDLIRLARIDIPDNPSARRRKTSRD